jgi:hypothetical protein
MVESPSKSGYTGSWFEAGSLTIGISGASAHNVTPDRLRQKKK